MSASVVTAGQGDRARGRFMVNDEATKMGILPDAFDRQTPTPNGGLLGGVLPSAPPSEPGVAPASFNPLLAPYNAVAHMANSLLTLPRQAYNAAAQLQYYSPRELANAPAELIAPIAEAAMLPMSGTLAGAPRGSFGAGPVRTSRGSLPTDEASRMARAKEMGFYTDIPLAHGTASEFRAFDPARQGAMTRAEPARMGVWTEVRRSGRPTEIADQFAEMAAETTWGNPQVYPLVHRAQKPASISLTGEEMRHEIAATLDDLWSKGYAKWWIDQSSGGQGPGTAAFPLCPV